MLHLNLNKVHYYINIYIIAKKRQLSAPCIKSMPKCRSQRLTSDLRISCARRLPTLKSSAYMRISRPAVTQQPGQRNSGTCSARTPKQRGWNQPSRANGQASPSHCISSSSADPQKQYGASSTAVATSTASTAPKSACNGFCCFGFGCFGFYCFVDVFNSGVDVIYATEAAEATAAARRLPMRFSALKATFSALKVTFSTPFSKLSVSKLLEPLESLPVPGAPPGASKVP